MSDPKTDLPPAPETAARVTSSPVVAPIVEPVVALRDLDLPSGRVAAGTVILGATGLDPDSVRPASEAEVELARPLHLLDLGPAEPAAPAKGDPAAAEAAPARVEGRARK